jgi:hypothetical protein
LLCVVSIVAALGISLAHAAVDRAPSESGSSSSEQPHHDSASCPVCIVLSTARTSLPTAPLVVSSISEAPLFAVTMRAPLPRADAPRRNDPARAPPSPL